MYLKSVKINNFRKIKETECFFVPGLNLIVGPNDSGKTAVIDAIRFTLRQVVDDFCRISRDDFQKLEENLKININFSFEDSKDTKIKEMARFAEYLSYSNESPELNIWFTVKSDEDGIKFPVFKVGPTEDVAVEMDKKCKESLKVVYLKPLRDAENDLKAKQGSRISKILCKHEDICANQDALAQLLQDFKDHSEHFFENEGGKSVLEEVSRLLNAFDEQAVKDKKKIKIGPTPSESLDFMRTLERVALYYHDLPKPGLGTQNMIFIAAELLHLVKQQAPKLILVEEIEAHLHPQRQLKIIKALQKESEGGVQMILTTHSPNLASAIDVGNLSLFVDGSYYSLAKGKTKLHKENYQYLSRFLDVTKANLFFAQGVMLVEGPTEQMLVPEFAKILGVDLTDFGVSVISVNGLSFEHFVNIFKRNDELFNQIPIVVITDADKKSDAEIKVLISNHSDQENNISCFVGEQIYQNSAENNCEDDLDKRTTFEKIILTRTTKLKELYIKAYNTLKDRQCELSMDMDLNDLYKKISREKAPVAQEVAYQLTQLSKEEKELLSKEISDSLSYIRDAINAVTPKALSE